MEWLGLFFCLAGALAVLAFEPEIARGRRLLAAAVAIGAVAGAFALLIAQWTKPSALMVTEEYRPGDARRLPDRSTYAGSTTCRSCHPEEYESWNASYHRRMTEPATLEGIVPDIVDERFEWQGRWYRIWREGDHILTDAPRFGTDGSKPDDRVIAPVVMTTGSHHMQAYWTPVPDAVTGEHERGRALFNARCAVCHGKEGRGGNAVKLLGGGFLEDEIRPWVQSGVFGHQEPSTSSLGVPTELIATPEADAGVGDDAALLEIVPFGARPSEGDIEKETNASVDDAAEDAKEDQAAHDDDGAAIPAAVPDAVRFEPDEVEAVVAFLLRVQFDGKLAQFPYVYLVEKKRWVHEEDSFLQPPVEVDAQERAGDRWGYNCDECHSTGASWGYLTRELTARSDAVDLGIACESCHGPAREHVQRERDPVSRYRRHLGEMPEGKGGVVGETSPAFAHGILQPARLPKDRASHICAQCHADLERTGAGYLKFQPGDDLEKFAKITYVPKRGEDVPDWLEEAIADDDELLSGGFWDDGTVRIAGRDFNGLKESGCYTRGEMSCLSCHSMHQGRPDDQLHPAMDPASPLLAANLHGDTSSEAMARASDTACTTCHADIKSDEAIAQHTHHPPQSEGSRCVNCHMPYTTYGLLKAIRAHRVDSPTVEMTTEFSRPNACNLCHLDQPLAFTDTSLQEWYGKDPAELEDVDRELAAGVRWALRGDAVVRAITAWHMGWGPAREASARDDEGAWLDHYLAYLLEDPYVAVRLIAEHRLRDDVGGPFAGLSIPYPASLAAQEAARAKALSMVQKPSAKAVDDSLLLQPGGLDPVGVRVHLRERDTSDVRVNE